jgi:mannose-6-phosphate isomerase-like protein (cupin superfamily)
MTGPVVHGPDGGELIEAGGGSTVTIKADGEMTAGSFYLGEGALSPGFPGPPPHTHERLHDMFYVLEGTLTIHLEGDEQELGPGSFACVPPGTVHTFSNHRDHVVRFLNFNSPAGWENYMRDLGAAFAGDSQPTPDEIGRIAYRYDFRVASSPS